MNKEMLRVEAVGLYTQPRTFPKIGTIAMKRFREVDDAGVVGEEFDAIMIYPPPGKNSSANIASFSDAAAEVAVDPLYMDLSRELRTVDDVEMHAVRQFDRREKAVGPYHYYILTGSMLAAVQCVELLVADERVISELRHIAHTAIDKRDKLKRFPWRPECVSADPFLAKAEI